MLNKKIEIVKRMVENGYCLFNETIEHFAQRFDLHVLEYFEEEFNKKNE